MSNRRALFLILAVLFVAVLTAGARFWGQRPAGVGRIDRLDPAEFAPLPPVNEAIAVFEGRVQAGPERVADLTLLGQLYLRRGRERGDAASYAQAEAALQRAIELSPDNTAARLTLAQALFAQHRFAEALAVASALYAEDPRRSDALVLIWDVQLALGQYEAAAETGAEVAKMPASPSLLARRAYEAELYGDLDHALALMEQGTAELIDGGATANDLIWYLTRLGDLHWKRGEQARAEAYYDAALRLQPAHYVALAGKGRARAAAGDLSAAASFYQAAIDIVPEPAFLAALGDVYWLQGDAQRAEDQYATVRAIGQLAQANQQLYNRQLALFLANHERNVDEALTLTTAELAQRQDVYGYDAHAWALYRAGRFDEAAQAMSRALALGTDEALFYYHDGLIQAALGQREAAIARLEQALARNDAFDLLQAAQARQVLATLRQEAER